MMKQETNTPRRKYLKAAAFGISGDGSKTVSAFLI